MPFTPMFYLGKSFDDQMLGILSPVADQLLWLNLARTGTIRGP